MTNLPTHGETCNTCNRIILGISIVCENCMSYFHPNDCQTENLECPNNDKNFICRKCEVDNLPFNQLNETDFQNMITSLTADEIEHDNINLRNFIISYYSNKK